MKHQYKTKQKIKTKIKTNTNTKTQKHKNKYRKVSPVRQLELIEFNMYDKCTVSRNLLRSAWCRQLYMIPKGHGVVSWLLLEQLNARGGR